MKSEFHSPLRRRISGEITSLTRRTVYYLLVLIAATLALTGAYSVGMSVWEGRPRPWYQSLQVLVADVADDENASIALAAREADPDGRVITLVEDASLAQYHRAAGADITLSPRNLLGQSLAARVPIAAAADVEDDVAGHEDIDFAELVATRQSPLRGRALTEVDLPGEFGVRVIGAWVDGSFETSVAPETTLDDHIRLFVAGTADQLAALRQEVDAYVRAFTSQSILLAGFGDSGHAVAESLRQARAEVTVIDVEDRDGVDVVGDVRDPDVLRTAGIAGASALVIAVDDDTVATFATLIARDLNPELQILVRAQEETAVQNLYRAGADFVQALPIVCGQMLATTVFEDDVQPSPDQHVNVVRLPAFGLEGQSLNEVDPAPRANYTVLAVSRGDAFLTDPDDEDFAFEADDEVIVAGTDDGLRQFRERFRGSGSREA